VNKLSNVVDDLRQNCSTIKKYGDNTIQQLLTALVELRMSNKFWKEWIIHQENPHAIPPIHDLLAFSEEERCRQQPL